VLFLLASGAFAIELSLLTRCQAFVPASIFKSLACDCCYLVVVETDWRF
jgi:hypothetical protein